jgi:hypothetical protein
MSESKNIDDAEITKDEFKNKQKIHTKKYRIHGRITGGEDNSSIEISYYECDEIKCSKIVYKKNKNRKDL